MSHPPAASSTTLDIASQQYEYPTETEQSQSNGASSPIESTPIDHLRRLAAALRGDIFALAFQSQSVTAYRIPIPQNGSTTNHLHICIATVVRTQRALANLAMLSRAYHNDFFDVSERDRRVWPKMTRSLATYLHAHDQAMSDFEWISGAWYYTSGCLIIDNQFVLNFSKWTTEMTRRIVRAALLWRMRRLGTLGESFASVFRRLRILG